LYPHPQVLNLVSVCNPIFEQSAAAISPDYILIQLSCQETVSGILFYKLQYNMALYAYVYVVTDHLP